MKFYDSAFAPNPRRVRIVLAEKGITVPSVRIDIAALEHRGEAYAIINPLRRVPALELDDGTVITESVAICRYFDELNPDPPMFGTDPLSRAMVEMWNRRIECDLYASVAAAFRHTHPAMAQMETPQIAAWGEINRPRALDFLTFLDRHLADHEFVTGGAYTIADVTLLVTIDFMKPARITLPDSLHHVRRWHAAASARPSAKA